MINARKKEVSLSWLVVSTRDYKAEYDWFLDKRNNCCYGILKTERTGCIAKDLNRHYKDWKKEESYFEDCVLMPELQVLSIEEAASYLRGWCDNNNISFKDDLDRYKTVEAQYWGYDE